MTPAHLAQIGAALYGPRWKTEIARELDVSQRTVRRWSSGSYEIPEGIEEELGELRRSRIARLRALASQAE